MEHQVQGQESIPISQQIKTIIQTGTALKKWQKLSRNSRDRYLRLNQLITTEAQYLSDLKLTNQKMQVPLKECGAISQYQEKEMFPNIEGMINLSHQMYSELSQIFSGWTRRNTLIGKIMVKYSRFMLVYSDFFKNYENTSMKLKLLIQNNKQVKQIEDNLREQSKSQTFLNLLSKPFQRALKYHLILKDYHRATPPQHPDRQYLELAIEEYHKVNQRNNEGMEHKEKNDKLVQLEKTFSDLIGSDARYLITQSQAIIFDTKVRCYILSDRVLISSIETDNQTELLRIQINNDSFITRLKDGVYLKNRLLLCGKKVCVHVTFKQAEQRDRFATYLFGAIQNIFNNQNYKEGLRNNSRSIFFLQEARRTRAKSMDPTLERETASSLSPEEYEQQELRQTTSARVSRESLLKSESMLPRPPRISVLGPIRRQYSPNYSVIYYLTKIRLPFPSDCHQMLYIPEEDMLLIEKMSRIVYYQQRDFINAPLLEQLLKMMQSLNDIRNQEYKTLYFTLLLNTIFRHPEISKRLDIFAHKMGITEGFWLALKYPNFECRCHNCSQGSILSTIERYNQELEQRNKHRTMQRTFFCPFRTFHVQEAVTTLPPSEINIGIDRLFWINCFRGCIEYRLLDNPPLDYSPPREVTFNISYGLLPMKYERHIKRQDRVGQVKHNLSKQLNIDLSQYQICLQISGANYILGEDQILYTLLDKQQEPEKGFGNFLRSTFGTVEDTNIRVFIKRVWWFVQKQTDALYLQRYDLRIDFFIESLAGRIKSQQIQLNIKDTITFYACYLIYKREVNVTQPLLECLVPPKKWKMLSQSVQTDMLQTVRERVSKLTDAFLITEGSNFKKYIFTFLMKILKDRPIWGVFLYQGTLVQEGKDKVVRVGFDLETFVIREPQKVTAIYEQKLLQIGARVNVSSWELRVKGQQKQYLILGSQFQQMARLLDLYIHYAKTLALAK